MLNTVIVMGRLTADPEVKSTGSGISVCSFTVAVDRRMKSQSGERQADFIRCVAWRERADFLARFFRKGSMVAVTGSLQVRNYEDKNGFKREAVEVVADHIDFTGEKSQGNAGGSYRDEVPLPPPPPARGGQSNASAPAFSNAGAADFDEIAGDDDLPF
ncbi:MAG: single-stranded DNA-binding protein [Oscillospiraceae bacterium]|jgi:single-strand DNA-binding protein|nr:single-stranded DNA-binding protein [Oscillospiraceae bacterium]